MSNSATSTKKRGSGISFVLPDTPAAPAVGEAAEGGAAAGHPRAQPRTGVGLLATSVFESRRLEDRIGALEAENQQLASERGAQLLDPKTITVSRWANRHPDSFASPAFADLRREIETAGGNVQPIKVRPVRGPKEGGAPYEIVFGHRRHRACLDLGLPVLTIVEDLDDSALYVQMERENRGRESLSAWEQGRTYLRAIDEKLFGSLRQLSAAIGRDFSDVGKAMRIAKLPAEITGAFPSPNAIQFRWVGKLERALAQHPDKTLAAARSLSRSSPRPDAAAVFAALTSSLRSVAPEGVGPSHTLSRQLKLGAGRVGTVTSEANGSTTIVLPAGFLDSQRWDALEEALVRIEKS